MLHVWVSHVPPPYSLSPSNNHCVGAGGKCVSLVYTQLRCWMDGGVWASSQHQLHPLAEAEKALFSQHVLTTQCRTWYALCEKVVICTNQIVIWRLQVFMAIRHKAADLSVYYLNVVWPGCLRLRLQTGYPICEACWGYMQPERSTCSRYSGLKKVLKWTIISLFSLCNKDRKCSRDFCKNLPE